MYIIYRTKDQRPIAGIFDSINTLSQAERVLNRWQSMFPEETFQVTEVDNPAN